MIASFEFELDDVLGEGIRGPGEGERDAEPVAPEPPSDEPESNQREHVEEDRREVRGRQGVPLPCPAEEQPYPGM